MSTTTLAYVIGILSCIGAATVARWLIEAVIGLWQFVREARRSFIQARRIERAKLGRGKRFGLKKFVRVWVKLCGGRRSGTVEGPHGRIYRLPYDVRLPITRVW